MQVDLTEKRTVSATSGQELADEVGIGYMETSALSGHNVDAAFTRIAQESFYLNHPRPPVDHILLRPDTETQAEEVSHSRCGC